MRIFKAKNFNIGEIDPEEIGDLVKRSVFPLVARDGDGKYQVYGSSVFVYYEYNGERTDFLVTAKHVINDYKKDYMLYYKKFTESNPLSIYIDGNFIGLVGICYFVKKMDNQESDIAVFTTFQSEEFFKALDAVNPLAFPLKDFENYNLYSLKDYIISGFPFKEAYKGDDPFSPLLIQYYSNSIQKEELYKSYNKNTYYITQYNTRRHKSLSTMDRPVIPPDPHGCSGGAMFSILRNKDSKPEDDLIIFEGFNLIWEQSRIISVKKSIIRNILDKIMSLPFEKVANEAELEGWLNHYGEIKPYEFLCQATKTLRQIYYFTGGDRIKKIDLSGFCENLKLDFDSIKEITDFFKSKLLISISYKNPLEMNITKKGFEIAKELEDKNSFEPPYELVV